MTSATAAQPPPAGILERELRARPTPLLRLDFTDRPVLVKLESLRSSGGVYDRALGAWDAIDLQGARELFADLSGAELLAAAGWARARGLALHACVRGPITHEVDETRKLWGAQRVAPGQTAQGLAMPTLSGPEAIEAYRRSLGTELPRQLGTDVPNWLIAPAGALAALLGAGLVLRELNPQLELIAIAGREEGLPELPSRDEAQVALARLGGEMPALQPLLDRVRLAETTRDAAAKARAQLARKHGVSASHAAAAAIAEAASRAAPDRIALAILSTTGEREFSLDAKVS